MIVRMLLLGGALLAAAHREVPEGLPGRYRSVLPVDGCPGLEFTVTLDEAGDYTFDYAYIEWKTRQSERGTYRVEGDTVACVSSACKGRSACSTVRAARSKTNFPIPTYSENKIDLWIR